MNLSNLFKTQKVLDERIVKEKGLEGIDFLPEKILALLTELGELSNEWRGFKFWSEDKKPRGERECQNCGGQCHRLVFVGTRNEHEENCPECSGNGTTNRVLEEYVDCLHFILSIGLELKEDKYIDNIEQSIYEEPYRTNDITLQFSYVFSLSTKVRKQYKSLFSCFVALGEMLGFTWEQIEAAYYEKNKINHTRQDTGY